MNAKLSVLFTGMTLKQSSVPATTALAFLLCTASFRAEADSTPLELTYVDLVERLTDLEHLATLPEPGEKTAQWSSYDRASKYDETAGKYVHWDANGDGNGIIRKENGKLVFAEMHGPGCIWRIWSATPKEGHVRIYLDGASEPAVDLPFAGYFDCKNEPFTRPALVHTVAAGWNNYTPIPYQKSCKIVADQGWGAYYHFVYTTFPKGTRVPTFKRTLSLEENAALDEADKLLRDCGPFSGQFAGRGVETALNESPFETIPAGGQLDFVREGPAAITSIRVKFADIPPPPTDRDVLRALTLEIRWDQEKAPSVWSPLGDFFGTAPGANPYRSWPCGLSQDGWWYSHWFMPFSTNARIRLRNGNPFAVKIKFNTELRPINGDVSRYTRFHAKWHRDEFLPTQIERQIDWPLLITTGRGRFVGVMLHVWNPRGGWWGEGDEKFFVDGEKFPSTFGTGSEDYFGYAWSSPMLFQHAYHNQTHNDGNSRGHISVNRWHIADQVPFQKEFEGCIEKYFPNERPTLYASTVYWYLEPGGHDPYSPQPLEERTGYFVQAVAKKVPGAIEGESLKILATTGGHPQQQDMAGFGDQWSNDAQLWWTDAKPGDKLDLALPLAKDGNYKLFAQLSRAVDYSIVQLSLDGEKLTEPIDLYNNSVIPTGELDLGTHTLSAGEHTLTVEIVGANSKAVKSYMFGLDYVKLVETK
jgi:hypothetical protein